MQEDYDVVKTFFPEQFPRGTELSLERIVDGHEFVIGLPGFIRGGLKCEVQHYREVKCCDGNELRTPEL